MRALHDAGNDRIRLAKVRLGMTRRVRQRHQHLPQTKVPFANVILHDRLLAREAMFVTKTLEDPLRRVVLLAVNRAILFQNAVDDIRERRQLRALRRLASPISRRFLMQQYLGNRLAIDPELARSFPSAQTLTMTRQSHSSIKIHSVTSPTFHQVNPDKGYRRSHIGPPPQPDKPAASLGDYCSAVLSGIDGHQFAAFAQAQRSHGTSKPV